MELSQTACRYLLTIYELGGGLDAVRSVDVSRRLNVAASSVAHMLGILDREGMIERRRYGRVRLTPDRQPALHRPDAAGDLSAGAPGCGRRHRTAGRRPVPVLPLPHYPGADE